METGCVPGAREGLGRGPGCRQGPGENAPATRKLRRSSPSRVCARGVRGSGERDVVSGPTYPSALGVTGILDLFGLWRNHRDPDINPIWEAQELWRLLF